MERKNKDRQLGRTEKLAEGVTLAQTTTNVLKVNDITRVFQLTIVELSWN